MDPREAEKFAKPLVSLEAVQLKRTFLQLDHTWIDGNWACHPLACSMDAWKKRKQPRPRICHLNDHPQPSTPTRSALRLATQLAIHGIFFIWIPDFRLNVRNVSGTLRKYVTHSGFLIHLALHELAFCNSSKNPGHWANVQRLFNHSIFPETQHCSINPGFLFSTSEAQVTPSASYPQRETPCLSRRKTSTNEFSMPRISSIAHIHELR